MSDRGSFVTEYIYCSKCLDVARDVLCTSDKYWDGSPVECTTGMNDEKPYPIIAGKVGSGGGWAEEVYVLEDELMPEMAKRICHPIRIAIIPETENSEKIVTVHPEPRTVRDRYEIIEGK